MLLPPNDNERVDVSHDDTPLRYRGIDNVLGNAPVPEQAVRKLVGDTQLRELEHPYLFCQHQRLARRQPTKGIRASSLP